MIWEEYQQKLPKIYTDKEISLMEKAFDFAHEIHKEEKRLTGGPFIDHPVAVSLLVANLQMDAQAVIAALLHDTYETDETALKKIRKQFGNDVAFLVRGLSKVGKAKYSGVERSAESTRKMFMAMAQDLRVIIIKLFDRLDNIGTLHVMPEEKKKRIALETLEIYAPVADRLGMSEIKLQLEDAAFKHAYPEEYEWIVRETREKNTEREKYLKKFVIPVLEKELEKEKIPVKTIHYRAKHYYSLWKKLLRYNMDWKMIYDLAAVRIIVDSVEHCYAVLGAIHKLWRPLPGRIKDYIALPKQNGYQSLHTTVFCVDNKITEFQIRTKKMHEEAEHGIAAHWAWEMAGKPTQISKMPHKKFTWIRQLQNWHKDFDKNADNTSGEKFLESLKIDFFKDRIFVLTPEGDIIDLPEGATPIDFAYHIHSEIGNSAVAAKVNNRIVPLSYKLESGDIAEILTQKNKKPNLKLLEFAKTSTARNQIRVSLKKGGFLANPLDIKKKPKKAEVNIVVKERIGMIKDVSSVFSSFKVNITSLITKETESNYASVYAAFVPKNKEQVEKITTRIKNIKGVEEVSFKY